MIEFTSLYLFLMGMISCAQGQRFTISTKFMNGKLTFKWSNISSTRNDIIITKDDQASGWIRVNDNQYTVEDVLQYKSVTITVREYNPFTFSDFVNYYKTYNVNVIESKEGESRNVSWTVEDFPRSGLYFIFRAYNGSVSRIISIDNALPPPTEKYVYHTRPYDSVNILFEVRNISVEDAGYYVGGYTETDALSGDRGVVLIVSGKPLKPIITGNQSVTVRRYAILKCESRSTSGPDYYKNFPPLSYSWFVNNTRRDGDYREKFRFIVSKEDKYNRYSCQAKEILESDRSEEIRINPFYGPESVIISPQPPNNGLSIHNGDAFGPYSCSADCNPPCTLQWKYKNPLGSFRNATSIGYSSVILPEQTLNRASMTSIRCIVHGAEGRKTSNIKFNIQYKPRPPLSFSGTSKTSCCTRVNLTWTSNFNGGLNQVFILKRKDGSLWKYVANITDPGERKTVHFDPGCLNPGQEDSFQLESCNAIECSSRPVEFKVTKQDGRTDSRLSSAQNIFIVVGVLAALSVLILTHFGVYKFAHHKAIASVSTQPPQPSSDLKTMNKEYDDDNDVTVAAHDQVPPSQTYEDIIEKCTEQSPSLTDYQNTGGFSDNQYEELKSEEDRFYTSLNPKN